MLTQVFSVWWLIGFFIFGLLIGGLGVWFVTREKLNWMKNAQEQMKEAFEALSSRILINSSDELIKRSREQTESILNQARGDWKIQKTEIESLIIPLKDNLKDLDKNVHELESKREGAYKGLEEHLRQLSTSHTELQKTTLTLTQAMKSPTIRGRWGELQLRRVIEMAGMVNHVSFDEQVSTGSGRPDVVIYLPNGGLLPIDSKVPLNSYLEAMEGHDEQVRQQFLDQHSTAVRSRIRDLSLKKYWDQFTEAPEFVIMFIPNEACLGAAFDSDPGLFEYAIDKKVLITTPVTLLALLKTVAYGWQHNQLTENAKKIANQGQELYKRFDRFIKHLVDLQKSLNNSINAFNRAIGSLENRVLPSARKLQELGVSQVELASPNTIDSQARSPTKTKN